MLDKLDWVHPRYEELGALLSDPTVVQDQEKWRALMREHSQLEPLDAAVKRYAQLLSEREEAKAMLADADMAAMAREELVHLEEEMPACERQLVRFAGEVLEAEYAIRAESALALMWQAYRNGCAGDNDPLVCTQEAAAALAWNYLLGHDVRVSVRRLARLFGCRERRMVFYARRMAAVLEKQGEIPQDDEDH